MQNHIHPTYHRDVEVVCACGGTLITGSVMEGPIRAEICSQCHPYFTGEKRLVDTEGQVQRFERQREFAQQKQVEAQQREETKKKSSKDKEDKQQKKTLTLKELLEQGR